MLYNFLIPLLLSGFLGALIGFDREKISKKRKSFNFAGIRTSSLIAILGFLIYQLETMYSPIGMIVLVGFLGALIGSFLINVYQKIESGATSEIAILITLIIGFMCGNSMFLESTILSILTVLVLSFKQSIHLLVNKISSRDFKFSLFFLVFAFVILPLLKDVDYGWYGFFNPRELWIMVILISGLSFVSYILERIFYTKNTLYLTSFLGGLISSTATTLNLAIHINKNTQKISNAIILTSLAMFVRVFLEISFVNINLGINTIIFIALLILMSLFMVFKTFKKSEFQLENIQAYDKPFEIKQAVIFAMFFTIIKLIIAFLNNHLGDAGVYLSSFISGFIDTDAVSLALAASAGNELGFEIAKRGVILALIANTLMKLNMVFLRSENKQYLKVLNFTMLTVIIGFISFYLPLN